jgi:hypothetical protein
MESAFTVPLIANVPASAAPTANAIGLITFFSDIFFLSYGFLPKTGRSFFRKRKLKCSTSLNPKHFA